MPVHRRLRLHAPIRYVVTLALLAALAVQMLPVPSAAPPWEKAEGLNAKQNRQKAEVAQPTSSLIPQSSAFEQTPQPALSRVDPEHDSVASSKPAIEGWVRSIDSSQAVASAIITLDGREQAVSDLSGYFRFEQAQLTLQSGSPTLKEEGRRKKDEAAHPLHPSSLISHPSRQVGLSVSAEGYGLWSLGGATYYAGDTLRVYPTLNTSAQAFIAPSQATEARYSAQFAPGHKESLSDGPQASLASFDSAPTSAPPATIRVYRTQSETVEVVPFRDYLKHVLPNEWIPSWAPESLKAGAMAVKTYAWYWVVRGGKQVALGADLKDNTEDQVYDPNVSYASTDAAVDATYNYAMLRNGSVFQAQYCAGAYAGDPTGDCPWSGPYMTQWGSAYHADRGRTWGWLLGFYYPGVAISPAPPGGGYDGTPAPQPKSTQAPVPTRQPAQATPTVASVAYEVGQGSNKADVFQEAYERNGGKAVLGSASGPVRWWLTYVTEYNVLAQPFSGPKGQGDMWIVYDVLKSDSQQVERAFLLSGDIAAAYKAHTPPGPEWVGAPTSDPYTASASMGGLPSQGFAKGTLSLSGQAVTFAPWPKETADWRAEYFVGYQPTLSGVAPNEGLPGRPTLVSSVLTPNFHWLADLNVPLSMGVGRGEWSVQITKKIETSAASYDFTLTSNSGARLWIDGLLAINGWNWGNGGSEKYNADLSAGAHTIRVQYYNVGGRDTNLDLNFAPRVANPPTATPQVPIAPNLRKVNGQAALRLRMTWLGLKSAQNGWVQPVTLSLSDPQTAQVEYTFSGQTDRNGVAYFGDLPPGSFNVHVKGQRSLQTARANISLVDKTVVDLDMKEQIAGDLDGDNCVTVDDFSIVQTMLGAGASTPGFNPAADLNGDGVVTMSDISLLRAGFDRCGDISILDFGFWILDLPDGAVQSKIQNPKSKIEEDLLPWTQPERLDHNLSLQAVASRTKVRRGEVIEVQVVADTGAQPIDGASFVLSYDPRRLKPVDERGLSVDTSVLSPGAALPAVMGNWIDTKGGFAGYAAGFLQGDAPAGRLVIATLRFQVLPGGSGSTQIGFAPLSSPNMQVTNGGTNLLARTTGLELVVAP